MMQKLSLFLFSFLLISLTSSAQIREIPESVKEAFSAQYPGATNVEYKDNLVSIHVYFSLNGEKMISSYNNKGRWKETEKEWNFDSLTAEVKDGFQKSKYATEWKVTETKIVYRAGGAELYRVKVEKNEVQRKHLFFNKNGRLVEDSITL